MCDLLIFMKTVLLIFTTESVDSGRANPESLMSALNDASHGIIYDFVLFDELDYKADQYTASITNTKTNRDIQSYDFVYLRRWGDSPDQAMACSIYLEKNNVPYSDTESIGLGSRSKLTQYFRLWQYSLPFPSIRVASAAIIINSVGTLKFPLVAKSVDGTRGEDNFLVTDKEKLLLILNENNNSRYIIQQFIENDGDYRVFIVGNKVRLLIYRKSDSYLNNISQGASAEMVPLSTLNKAQTDDCIKAASVMKREIAGVDLVISKRDDRHYIFEVNRSPQIENSSYVEEKVQVLDRYIQSIIDK